MTKGERGVQVGDRVQFPCPTLGYDLVWGTVVELASLECDLGSAGVAMVAGDGDIGEWSVPFDLLRVRNP